MERALYDPEHGFYESGQAGRRGGHFITSPEVGPLFGAVVGRMLDRRWKELGRPDPFTVVDAGAGPGTLARTVAKAEPDCTPVLHWINIERSATGRGTHTVGESSPVMPEGPITGVVVANELLDNLPLRLFDPEGDEVGEHRPSPETRLTPRQDQACAWLAQALSVLERGTVVVIDYMSTTEEMASRPWPEWLRTYRGHERGDDPWTAPGTQDITCEVALDQLSAVALPPGSPTRPPGLRTRHRRTGGRGQCRLASRSRPGRSRCIGRTQPGHRSRGPARPGRTGRIHRGRMGCTSPGMK